MQWLMLQQKNLDYVISTGVQHTVRDFVNLWLKNENENFVERDWD